MGESAVIVRPFERADEPGVLDLLATAFAGWPRAIEPVQPAEFFRWKHLEGPFGRSVMLVSAHDGALTGFAAYMPWRMRVHGQIVTAVRGVDLAVHPEHRRRGISQALRAQADRLMQGSFFWGNPSEPARRGGLKHGRLPVGRIPHFARFCGRATQSARRAFRDDLRTAADLPVRAPDAAHALADGEYVSRLLEGIPHALGCLTTDRDAAYLSWRYGRFGAYHAVTAGQRNGRGIAIFRPRIRGGFNVLDVCELLAEGDEASVVRDLLRRVTRAAAADFLLCNFRSRRQAARHGFVQASRGMCIYMQPLRGSNSVARADPRGWALSRGDLELL